MATDSSSPKTDYDVIVVGAGIFGICAAYHCQKKGLKTLIVEQFKTGHSNGSSHGKSRITRYAHTEKEYVPLVDDAYRQIEELENKNNSKLWKKTGLLWVADGDKIEQISNVLKEYDITHEVMEGSKIKNKYPQFDFTDEWRGLVDPMGGVLYADKIYNAFTQEFLELGGTVSDNETVLSFTEDDVITIQTSKKTLTTKKLIFTVGAWITKLFLELPLKIEPISISVCFWKTKKPEDSHLLNEDNFPVFIANETDKEEFHFGLPDTDYPGMIKFTYHSGDPLDNNLDHPEKTTESFVTCPGQFLNRFAPIIDGNQPGRVDRCKYTVSEDDHYVIDKAPGTKNVFIGGCGSGSGFKVAPGIGRALADLASGADPSIDVSFFSFKRFGNK